MKISKQELKDFHKILNNVHPCDHDMIFLCGLVGRLIDQRGANAYKKGNEKKVSR